MKCPTCNQETAGVNRNNRGIYCDQCGGFIPPDVVEAAKVKAQAKPKAPAKKTK